MIMTGAQRHSRIISRMRAWARRAPTWQIVLIMPALVLSVYGAMAARRVVEWLCDTLLD